MDSLPKDIQELRRKHLLWVTRSEKERFLSQKKIN